MKTRLLFFSLAAAIISHTAARAQGPDALYANTWLLQSIEHVGSYTELPVPGSIPQLRFTRDACVNCPPDHFLLSSHDGCGANVASYKLWPNDSITISLISAAQNFCFHGV